MPKQSITFDEQAWKVLQAHLTTGTHRLRISGLVSHIVFEYLRLYNLDMLPSPIKIKETLDERKRKHAKQVAKENGIPYIDPTAA